MSINRVKCGLAKHALISVSVGSPPQMASANHFALTRTPGSGYYGIPDATTLQLLLFWFVFCLYFPVFSHKVKPQRGLPSTTCAATAMIMHVFIQG